MGMWRDSGGKVAGLTVLALLVLLGGGYALTVLLGGDRMPRNAAVDGVDVGSMTREEATTALEESTAEARGDDGGILVTYGDGREVEVDPDEAGLRLDTSASLDRAFGGATWSPQRVWAVLTGGGDADAVVRVDREQMDAALDDLEEGLGSPVQEGAVEFRDGTPTPVYGTPGRGIEREEAQALLEQLMVRSVSSKLPIAPMEPTVSDQAVDTAVTELGEPAMSGPVTLVMAGKELKVAPPLLGRALSTEPVDGALELAVDGEALVKALEPRLERIGTAPVDASFVIRDGKPRVKPSQPGRELDPEEIEAGLVDAALGSGPAERRLEVEGRESEADFTTQDARALGIKRRVSNAVTYFPYAEYRNVNIGRAAELVDGTVLEPGEVFSLNGIVGERTAENGFTQGYVISDGIFRTDYGGGVSQMATTTFNAMFFAGLKDIEHKPHSVYIDRYPEGREATVAWPSLDLRFENDTDHGVLIKAKVTPSTYSSQGEVRVSMYSTKTWDITARKSERYNYTSPSTRYLTDADCEPASGTSGFTVDVWRDFRRPGEDKVVKTEKFNTVYIPGDTVVCAPPPAPEPERPRNSGGTTGGGGGDNAGGGNGGGGGN